MKLTRLSVKESSGEQPLNGVYHIIVDLQVTADKKVTLEDLQKKVAEVGVVDDLYIEKYVEKGTPETPFNVGDTIELTEDLSCEKAVYLDTGGNLVVSDSPVEECVEKVGDFTINLPRGITAEVNNKPAGDSIDILFPPEAILLEDLGRVAYLGVLTLPCSAVAKVS
jgi:hypothetical protein